VVTQWPGSQSHYETYQVGLGIEWVHDYYADDYYSDALSWTDPAGPPVGAERVLKASTWSDPERFQRLSFRDHAPGPTSDNIGFRCVRDAVVAP
jgi:formylglycine-generating enzyme required for sulfatase activity